MSHQINLVLVEPGAKCIGQFDRVCNKLLRAEAVVDVFAIGLAGTPTIPVHDHKLFLKFALKGVSQIHGRHAGTTMQEEQKRERRVVPTNKNVLVDATSADAFQRRDAVRLRDGGGASRSEPQVE